MTNATGPRTGEDKAVSSRNALRHGLTSAQVVLPGENSADFDALRDSLFQAHEPAAGLECVLLDQVAQCLWRLDRARRLELEALEADLTAPADAPRGALDKILRYVAAIERELHRSLRDFNTMQAARKRDAAQQHKSVVAERKLAVREESVRFQNKLHEYLTAPPPGFDEITKRSRENLRTAAAGRR